MYVVVKDLIVSSSSPLFHQFALNWSSAKKKQKTKIVVS